MVLHFGQSPVVIAITEGTIRNRERRSHHRAGQNSLKSPPDSGLMSEISGKFAQARLQYWARRRKDQAVDKTEDDPVREASGAGISLESRDRCHVPSEPTCGIIYTLQRGRPDTPLGYRASRIYCFSKITTVRTQLPKHQCSSRSAPDVSLRSVDLGPTCVPPRTPVVFLCLEFVRARRGGRKGV